VCDLRAELGELRRDLRLERGVLARERGELGDVLRARSEPIPPLEARAEVAEALERRLRALPVVPEIGTRGVLL